MIIAEPELSTQSTTEKNGSKYDRKTMPHQAGSINSDRKFQKSLLREMRASVRNSYTDNWDFGERGSEPEEPGYPLLSALFLPYRVFVSKVQHWYHASCRPLLVEVARKLFPSLEYRARIRRVDRIGYLYNRLGDEESRELLVKLFAFRIMGHRKVKLPRNRPEYWSGIQKVGNLPTVGEPLHLEFMNATLQLRDLSLLGFKLRVYCTPTGGSYSFVQKQYELHHDPISCKAEQGDVVIDAGACWGETSLYFAHEVGPSGKVVAFEFIPKNIQVLEQNILVNPEFVDRVVVVKQPVWSVSGQTLYYVDWGPGSRVSFEKIREDFADTKCVTTTIDETVARLGLERVDFIKMDIEGAELRALEGAANSIRKFSPKLAISLYHSIHDFQNIPPYIDSLGVEYDFHLDHHTIYENETVLFCIPKLVTAAVPRNLT